MPAEKPAPPRTAPKGPPPRRRWAWVVVKVVAGVACYALASLLLFVVLDHALSRAAAVIAVVIGAVLLPVALTQLLAPAFRRLDPRATFPRTLPGVAGLGALVTLVALPFAARGPVSQALSGAPTRYPHAGAVPLGAARAFGRALAPPVADAGVARDGGVVRDAGILRDAAAAVARDVTATDAATDATITDAALDVTITDAAADVAVADVAVADVAAAASEGAGVFAEFVPCEFAWGLQLADLEGDARDEVVVQCMDTVHVFAIAEGALVERVRFAPVAPAGLQARAGRPAVGDMDGDERADLVLCEIHTTDRGGGRGGAARYLVNRGDGRFGALVDLDRADGCGAAALGDVTGDGRPELLVAHAGNPYQPDHPNGSLAWFSRAGRAWTRRATLPVGRWPDALLVTDVNGDAIPDVVVGHGWDAGDLAVVLPGARNGLRPMDATLRAPALPPRDRATGRLDADDAPDTAEIVNHHAVRLSRSSGAAGAVLREFAPTSLVVPARPDAGAERDADAAAEPDDGGL